MVLVMTVLLALAGMTACTRPAEESFDAEKTLDRLLNEVEYAAELEDITDYAEYMLDGVPEGSEIKMYTAGGKNVDFVIMVKVPSADGVSAVREAIDAYIDSCRDEANRYEPEELPKLDSAVTYVNGEYVFAVAAADTETVRNILK